MPIQEPKTRFFEGLLMQTNHIITSQICYHKTDNADRLLIAIALSLSEM